MACPVNRIGEVDLFLTTHHGSGQSNAPVLVHALKARVAIMNNGARKGGDLPVLQTVKSAPGLEDLWMLHYAVVAGAKATWRSRRSRTSAMCPIHGVKTPASASTSPCSRTGRSRSSTNGTI